MDVIVKLDKERKIAFSNEAFFRIQKEGVSFEDLADPKKVYAATLSFIWAMLVGPHHFKNPEALAKHVDVTDFEDALKAVGDAVNATFTEKKSDG